MLSLNIRPTPALLIFLYCTVNMTIFIIILVSAFGVDITVDDLFLESLSSCFCYWPSYIVLVGLLLAFGNTSSHKEAMSTDHQRLLIILIATGTGSSSPEELSLKDQKILLSQQTRQGSPQ
jgi:hypothetical protein